MSSARRSPLYILIAEDADEYTVPSLPSPSLLPSTIFFPESLVTCFPSKSIVSIPADESVGLLELFEDVLFVVFFGALGLLPRDGELRFLGVVPDWPPCDVVPEVPDG